MNVSKWFHCGNKIYQLTEWQLDGQIRGCRECKRPQMMRNNNYKSITIWNFFQYSYCVVFDVSACTLVTGTKLALSSKIKPQNAFKYMRSLFRLYFKCLRISSSELPFLTLTKDLCAMFHIIRQKREVMLHCLVTHWIHECVWMWC